MNSWFVDQFWFLFVVVVVFKSHNSRWTDESFMNTPSVSRYWPYGSEGCQTHGFQGFCTALASIHFIAAIAWDRYHQYCTSEFTPASVPVSPPSPCRAQTHTNTRRLPRKKGFFFVGLQLIPRPPAVLKEQLVTYKRPSCLSVCCRLFLPLSC